MALWYTEEAFDTKAEKGCDSFCRAAGLPVCATTAGHTPANHGKEGALYAVNSSFRLDVGNTNIPRSIREYLTGSGCCLFPHGHRCLPHGGSICHRASRHPPSLWGAPGQATSDDCRTAFRAPALYGAGAAKLTGYLSHGVEKLFSVKPLIVSYETVKEFLPH